MQSELIVGMPIENAIYIIAEKFDSLLSREFLEAMNEMELGISGWQQARDMGWGFACTKEKNADCNFSIGRKILGKTISNKQFELLFQKGGD